MATIPKKEVAIRRKYIPWANYTDDSVRDVTNVIHDRNVKRIQAAVFGEDTVEHGFSPYKFEKPDSQKKVKEFLETGISRTGDVFSVDTRAGMISSLCKYLQNTPKLSGGFDFYSKLRDSYKAEVSTRKRPSVVEWKDVLPVIIKETNNLKNIMGLRIILAFMKHEVGAFRPNDFMNSRFVDDKEHSFMDLKNKQWTIRGGYTKNKQGRVVPLPEGLVKDIKIIFRQEPESYPSVLVNKKMDAYTDTTSLTDTFKRLIGHTFNDVRASFVTYIHNNKDMEKMNEMARYMGHGIRTAVTDYHRDKDEEED
jgi:integrase